MSESITCTLGKNSTTKYYFYKGRRIGGATAMMLSSSGIEIGPCMTSKERRKRTSMLIETCEKRLIGMVSSLKRLEQVSRIEEDLNEQRLLSSQSQKELDRTTNDLTLAEHRIDELVQLNEDTIELKKKLSECNELAARYNEYLSEAKKELTECKKNLDACNSDKASCMENLSKQIKSQEALHADILKYTNNINTLQTENSQIKQQLTLLAKQATDNKSTDTAKFQEQLALKNRQLAECTQNYEKCTADITKVQLQASKLNSQVADLTSKLTTTDKKLTESTELLAKFNQRNSRDLEVYKLQINNVNSQLRQKITELDDTQIQLAQIKGKFLDSDTKEKECVLNMKKVQADIIELNRLISSLKESIALKEREIVSNEQTIKNMQELAFNQQRENEKAQLECQKSLEETKKALQTCGTDGNINKQQFIKLQAVLDISQAKNRELMTRLEELTSKDKEKSDKLISESKTIQEDLKKTLQTCNDELTAIRSTIFIAQEKHDQEVNRLKQNLNACSAEVNSKQKSLGECMEQLQHCKSTSFHPVDNGGSKQLEEAIISLKKDLNKCFAEKEELQSIYNKLSLEMNQKLTEAGTKVVQTERAMQFIREKMEPLVGINAKLTEELSEGKKKINELETMIIKKRESYNQLSSENLVLKTDKRDLETKLRTIEQGQVFTNSRLTTLQNANNQLREQLAIRNKEKLTGRTQEDELLITELRRQIAQKEMEVQNRDNQLKAYEQENKDRMIADLSAQIKLRDNKLDEAENKYKQAVNNCIARINMVRLDKDERLEKLDKEIRELSAELTQTKEELDTRSKLIGSLDLQLVNVSQDYKDQLVIKDNVIRELEENLKYCQEDNTSLQTKVDEFTGNYLATLFTQQHGENQLKELEAEKDMIINRLKTEQSMIQQQLNNSNATLQSLEEELHKVRSNYDNISRECKNKIESMTIATDEQTKKDITIQTLTIENQNLHETYDELNKRYGIIVKELNDMKQEYENMRNQSIENSTKILSLTTSTVPLQLYEDTLASNAELNIQNTKLAEQHASLGTRYDALNQERASIEQKYNELSTRCSASEHAYENINTEYINLKQKHDNLMEKLNGIASEYGKILEREKDTLPLVEILKQNYATLEHEYNLLVVTHRQLVDELKKQSNNSDKNQAIAALYNDLQKSYADLQQMRQGDAEQINKLQQEYKRLKRIEANCELFETETRGLLLDSEKEIIALKKNIQSNEKFYLEYHIKYAGLENSNRQLRDKLENIRKKYNALLNESDNEKKIKQTYTEYKDKYDGIINELEYMNLEKVKEIDRLNKNIQDLQKKYSALEIKAKNDLNNYVKQEDERKKQEANKEDRIVKQKLYDMYKNGKIVLYDE